MRTDANAAKGHEFVSLPQDLETVKDWTKRVFTNDRIAEVGVIAATLMLVGYLAAVLYQGLHTFTMAGF